LAAQIAHGAVRCYAMGERGRTNADATPEEIDTIAALVEEALAAGAVGFSTSRTIGHRALWGSRCRARSRRRRNCSLSRGA